MSSKKYIGEQYSFFRDEKSIGRGGNGAVYNIRLLETNGRHVAYPLVAKFFEYEGPDKVKRYSRFKNEVRVLNELKKIDGIIEIVDKRCPKEAPEFKDEAWYLMPKAEEYKINQSRSIYEKLDDMLSLAYTLQQLHNMKLAHRDIKPGNILILNGKLVLSDFGLIWGKSDERLTEMNERIGPYKIMPPELEHIEADMKLEFMPSDVYLFAKVLWMNLKNDNIGFRGRYNRGDDQIYLNKNQYNVCTLEPIHKLIEQATYEDMNQRITINECIDYLLLQKQIFLEPQLLSEELIKQLKYDEERKRIIEKNNPDEYVYTKQSEIYNMLHNVIVNSDIIVKSLGGVKDQQIKISHCTPIWDNIFRLLFYANGKKVNEYLVKVKKMVCKIKEEIIVLELEDFQVEDSDYKPYGENKEILGMMSFKEYFSASEQIILSKPQTL